MRFNRQDSIPRYNILCLIYLLVDIIQETVSATLQTFNARLISQAYLVLFDNGGANLGHDYSSARAFGMLSA